MQKYKAIFFDWDGTAVVSRLADASNALIAMEKLLLNGVKLVVVSGTTYGNICNGKMENILPQKALQNLYFGLARGNYNYGFSKRGQLRLINDNTPDITKTLLLHEAVLALHNKLLASHQMQTDVIFSRPGYCKMDLMVDCPRSAQALFMQSDEVRQIVNLLDEHSINNGLMGLMEMAYKIGKEKGLELKVTTDAKYLEVGYTTKSDNVDYYIDMFAEAGIKPEECCFWGDEFGAIAPGVWGSDAQMLTGKTKNCDFYNVSDIDLPMPQGINTVGGGVDSFINFLYSQKGM